MAGPTYDKNPINFRLTPAENAALRRLALEREITLSDLIREALAPLLPKQQEEEAA